MLPSIRTVPVSGHLKQKLNFWGGLFSYRWTKYFEWQLNISALRWRFWRVESLQNSHRRDRSVTVQVNKHFKANIYAVYCAVKLVHAAQKRVGNMWYIRRDFFIFKVKILEELRFSESLLILLEIRFVWNSGSQKHSLSIDVRCPVSGQFFLCRTESTN